MLCSPAQTVREVLIQDLHRSTRRRSDHSGAKVLAHEQSKTELHLDSILSTSVDLSLHIPKNTSE